MNLPRGVSWNGGRFARLIAVSPDPSALITVDARLGYRVNDRGFRKSFAELWSKDYRAVVAQRHVTLSEPVYSGAEHKGVHPKLPNITVVPNVPTTQDVTLLGCTMGHFHEETQCPLGVQELYEFQSYGALVIDRPEDEGVELWVARDGDKIPVPQQCHMTLYNLDDSSHPLVTLDFADPDKNRANKELASRSGPILLVYSTRSEVVFVLNEEYINRSPTLREGPTEPGTDTTRRLNGGVRLANPSATREVRIFRGTRDSLGGLLYETLTGNPDVVARFARLGIRVRQAHPEAVLDGVSHTRPLARIVHRGGDSQLYRFFFPSASQPSAGEVGCTSLPQVGRSLHEGERRWSERGPRRLEPGRKADESAQRDIQILIEGAGAWVEQGYIPSLRAARKQLVGAGGPELKVIVADDSRWGGHSMGGPIPDPERYPELAQEVADGRVLFLDKANPAGFLFYRRLAPAVVFVVTPDYTHSQICTAHLDRAPTLFVEKPFDVSRENVRKLLEARGRAALGTQIYALDHYRFYAWRLKEKRPNGKTLLEEANGFLGGALRDVRFFMTETNAIERGRERSLQYGMMLDLLPHCLAMLAFFGELESLDEFEVSDVVRYPEAPIPSETYAAVRFTFEDYSKSGQRVSCSAWVGKGLSVERKYFEATGCNGNRLLVAFKTTTWRTPSGGDQSIEPGIYFVSKGGGITFEAPLEVGSSRYEQLFIDLVTGQRKAITSAMPLIAGELIVNALDSLWRAIQRRPTWRECVLRSLDCFDPF